MSKLPLIHTVFACLLLLGWGCQPEESTAPEGSKAKIQYLGPEQTGIDFVNQLAEGPKRNIIEYLYYYNGGGVAVGDINNDGLEDLFFTANEQPDKLYLNKGGLQFEDITGQAGILPDDAWSTGAVFADFNNDGYLDLYVCKVGLGVMPPAHNLLYLNQQDGTFKESTEEAGLNIQGFSTQACVLDYDKDGDLDLYLLNHNVHSVRSYGTTEKRQAQDPYAGDRFFENRLNEEEQAFVDVTEEVGIYNSPLGYGLAVSAADINGDGWTDIYVGNDFHENDYIYLNNRDNTFSEVIKAWTDHTTQFSMGVDIADLNNDLLPDIFSTDMLPFEEDIYLKSGGEDTDQIKRIKDRLGFEPQFARNHLQLNTGQASFIDLALQTRTFATDWSWAILMQDFDNNGWKDIFITNGIVKRPNDLDYINYLNSEAIAKYDEEDPERTRKLIDKLPSQKLRNILFLQQDELEFNTVNEAQVGKPTFSNGAAYADLDQDGFLEMIVNNINDPAAILKFNASEAGGNYLSLDLQNTDERTNLGTKVYAYAGGRTFYQELQTVKGYQSSSSHYLHFGLGEADQVDSLRIIWPDQQQQLLTGVKANQRLEIPKEPTATGAMALQTIESLSDLDVLPVLHEENQYVDDEQEKLIPEHLSREGPPILYEDLDGDGIKELLIGGAHGRPIRLLKGKADGSFEQIRLSDFTRDARYEDACFATIDFDNDGDRDLYVSSGGGAAKELDKALEDRLYLNNGNLDFRRVPLSLPHTNGSVVAVADYDGDGYEDLFVGARSMPGLYGLSPYSFILKNRQGTGVEIGYQHRFGMVTDAKWADFDGDGDTDLVLCGDWMPVTILENNGEGELDFLPEEANFSSRKGFWSTLELADLNEDGRLDILAGNLGTNSLMQASPEEPIKLYLGDFDENGSVDPLIFFPYFDRYVPLGSKDKYLSQLPNLKKRFVDYADFAEVSSFEDLLPEGEEQLVETKTVEDLRSTLFLSKSGGGYETIPLPQRVQWMKVQDLYWDKDKRQCLYIGSNKELVAARGNAQSARGGILGAFDPAAKEFNIHQPLELPVGLQARALVMLPNRRLLIITNNDYPRLVELP